MSFARSFRLYVSLLAIAVLALASVGSRTISAQAPVGPFFLPGRNVNTVGPAPTGPNPLWIGNPQHKQRNEASCDVSPNNPLVVLCANNDYRGVEQFGDSWIGLSYSRDGGLSWRSRLLEGFPSAPSGIGAADPIVRTVPGLGLVSYITLSRTDSRGTLSLALLAERNREKGEQYEFIGSRLIGVGNPGRFNDKPAMNVVLNEGGSPIDIGGRLVPRGTIHFAYALFPGNENNSSSQIYHLMSGDYGLTWSSPRKLSESLGINQGVDLAVGGTNVVAVWRQVADTNQSDAIVSARSTDGGQSWSRPSTLWVGPGRFFDQDTTPVQFRTLSMPSVVHDGTAFHAFWAARGFAANADDARIVVSSSRDGNRWSAPSVVDGHQARGHQIMPQAAVAGGRIQVNWIDTRTNEPGSFGRFIADFRVDADGNSVPLDAPSTPSDPQTFIYRQMGDIYGAQSGAASANGQPDLSFGPPAPISRYRIGLVDGVRRQIENNFLNARMFQRGNVPFQGDYHALAGQRYRPSETVAGAYVPNTAASTSHAVFYSAFTDNRDVLGYVWAGPPSTVFTPGTTLEAESGAETPVPCTPSEETTPDTTVWTSSDSPRSRFQNIYAAATFPGLIVASPSGSKPTGILERAYVVFVHNLTPEQRSYRLTIANQPDDAPPTGTGRAAFRPDDPDVPFDTCVDGAGCRALDVTIPGASSITRTVYVRSSVRLPRILVRVQENGGGGQSGSVILNPDPNAAESETPEGLPDILAFELYQPDLLPRQSTTFSSGLVNPDVTPVEGIQNPRIEYPRIEYPRIEYSTLTNPRIEYPRIEYDPLGNPRIEYPRIEYPRIEYKSVENPRIEYSALSADDVETAPVPVTEVTWPVTTDGANTTTAMSAKIFVNGSLTEVAAAQLLVSIPHFVTVTRTCDGEPVTVVENQVVVSTIIDPASLVRTPGGPDTVNPPVTQPTFFVPPSQVAYVTLRLVGVADAQLASRAGIIVRSQPDTSDGDVTDEDSDGGLADVTPPVLDFGALAGGLTVEADQVGGADVGVTVTATDENGPAAVSCVRNVEGSLTSTPVPVDGTEIFYSLGSSTVSCIATDSFGNQVTGGFPVTVQDTNAPTLDLATLSISLAYTAGGAVVTYDASAVVVSDVVDASPVVQCTPVSGSLLPLGTEQLTCTATDASGNTTTASRPLSVVDTVAPVLTVPDPILIQATSGGGAVVTFSSTAIDVVDPTVTVTCSPESGSTFTLGTTTVSCVATDASGNTSTATFAVTVRDATPPVLTVPGPIVSEATTAAGAVVTFSATATDLVDAAPDVVCTPASGSTFPLGTTTVSCVASDDSGNASSPGSFTVTVRDTSSPVLTLPAPITAQATSAAGAVVTYLATATDLVDATPTVTCTPASGSTFPLGTTTVSCVASDDSGNTSNAATFAVIVRDTTAPSSITASVSPQTLWPPTGSVVEVTVSGQAFDGESGMATIEWTVVDEYRQHQPSGSAAVAGNGPFSFTVPLLSDRRGNDKDGRHYTIRLTAVDRAGNRLLLAQPLVVNVHDQSGM